MGKKIQRGDGAAARDLRQGAIERGIEPAKAAEIFDLMAKFADYGFNKSHAAAYALVSYQTAWLKANHPVAFLAASMTLDLDKTEKLAGHMQEARGSASRCCHPTSTAPAPPSWWRRRRRASRRSASPWPR